MKILAELVPSEGMRENLLHASLLASGGSLAWHSLICRHITQISGVRSHGVLSVSVCPIFPS